MIKRRPAGPDASVFRCPPALLVVNLSPLSLWRELDSKVALPQDLAVTASSFRPKSASGDRLIFCLIKLTAGLPFAELASK